MSDFYNKYPYTDFHELNLDWVIDRVKKLTDDWLATHEEWVGVQQDWADTEQAWIDFKAYVENYLNNLDVQDEIDHKIDQMVSDGSLRALIQPDVLAQTVSTTTDWLADHITQPTTPAVDTSLLIPGAAADAAETGYRISINDDMDSVLFKNLLRIKHPYSVVSRFINKTTGAEQSNANFNATDYIAINTDILYMQKPFYDQAGLAFYDSSKTFISGVSGPATEGDLTTDYYPVQVPANAAYFRTSYRKSFPYTDICVDIGQISTAYNMYDDFYESDVQFPQTNGYISNVDGNFTANNQYVSSDYIPVYGTLIRMQMPFTDLAGFAFYDNSKTFISGVRSDTGTTDTTVYTIQIPANAAYFRTCKTNGAANDKIIVKTADTSSINENIEYMSNTLDSLASHDLAYTYDNYFVKNTDGTTTNNNNFECTGFIEVSGNYMMMQEPFFDQAGLAFYDSSKTFISGVRNGASAGSITDAFHKVLIPDNAKYFRTSRYKPADDYTIIGAVKQTELNISIPDTVYIVPNVPIRIFYYQICNLHSKAYFWKASGSGSITVSQADDYVEIKATATGTGSLSISLLNSNEQVIITKTITVSCVNNAINQKAIFIGDSFTDFGYYLVQLKSILGSEITLYGTRSTTETASDGNSYTVDHEGRAGWNARDYCTVSTGNPFYNNGFDFDYYMTIHPAYNDTTDVYIMLGMNGSYLNYLDMIINSIASYNPSINIHMILQPKLADESITYGAAAHKNLFVANDDYQKYWNDIYALNHDTIPAYINVDPVNNYPTSSYNISYRQDTTRTLISDTVHPNKYGYWNMTDVIIGQMRK